MIQVSVIPEPRRKDGTICPDSAIFADMKVTDGVIGGDVGRWIEAKLAQYQGSSIKIERKVTVVEAVARMGDGGVVIEWEK